MRADQGLAAPQLGIDLGIECRGEAAFARIGRVADGEPLARALPAPVDRLGRRRQFGNELRARGDERFARLAQFVVVRQQKIAIGSDRPAQQRRFLRDDLLVACQVPVIRRRLLRQRDVEKRAPQPRAPGDELQIGGYERHDARLSEEAREPDRRAVHVERFARSGRNANDAAVQAHAPRARARVAGDLRSFAAVAHEFGLPVRPKRLPGGEHRDGFEQIGLALSVGPHENIEPRRRLDVEALVVAEIREAQAFEKQSPTGAAASRRRVACPRRWLRAAGSRRAKAPRETRAPPAGNRYG